MSYLLRPVAPISAVVFGLVLLVAALPAFAARRPNVLFICVDDLRPQLKCYGRPVMVTPNLDRLAEQGRRFDRHFVAVPTCGASRYALLTGLRPSTTGGLNNNAFAKMYNNPDAAPESFVHLFRTNGYRTVGIGKISHHPDGLVYGYNALPSEQAEMPRSWDDMRLPLGKWKHGWDSFFAYADGSGRNWRRKQKQPAPPTEAAPVADNGYPDGLIALDAIEQLKHLKQQGKPFFLAVGFFKPHLPFNAPKKYWDLYPADKIELAPTSGGGKHGGGEMFGYTHPENARSDPDHHRHLRRAYFASVSYIDAQIGKVLGAVDELGLADNTVVIVWGDHGWHLGDLSRWGKHTLYDWSLRSALIIRTPGMKRTGAPAAGLVETIDLYPTLVDLCRLTGAPDNLPGVSLRPLLDNPGHPGKTAAFGYFGKGRTIRTDRYRLVVPNLTKAERVQLFDHQADPSEAKDIAADHADIVAELRTRLHADVSVLNTPPSEAGR